MPAPIRQLLTAIALLVATGVAAAIDLSGELAVEVRHFLDEPGYPNQLQGAQSAITLTPELRWRMDNGDRFTLIPRLRQDTRDSERSHTDLSEAYWLRVNDEWEWLVGVNRIFWGVAESRHLVDIINQTDEVAAFDGEEKLGQLMINLTARRDWGSVGFFLLPGFRERIFPGKDGRLRPSLPVDSDAAVFESTAKAWHTDLALRYSHYVGDWDIGAYYFYGTGREPRLLLNADGTHLTPYYDLIQQAGIDLQYTQDAWLLKLEAIAREGQGDTFGATVAGFEYTFYQISGNRADLGMLVEYHYDGRDTDAGVAPPTPFDNDLFLGVRLALNDTQDTSVLTGIIVDRDDHSRLLSIEAGRRLGTNWTLELEGRWFDNMDSGGDLAAYADDSFLSLRLTHHF
jgi:hypothetical protein